MAEVGVGTVAAGVAKANADVVLISGHDGGTGASPLTSIKHAGIPWELGLAETHQVLVLNDLRSRIVVETDGQLKTGRDVVVGGAARRRGVRLLDGAAGGGRLHHDARLPPQHLPGGRGDAGPGAAQEVHRQPDHVVNFMRFIAQEVRELMAQLGFRTINEMIGRTDVLEMKPAVDHWKAQRARPLDDPLPARRRPRRRPLSAPRRRTTASTQSLDMTTILPLCQPALERGEKVEATLPIRNVNRTVGTIAGSEVTRRYGADGLPDDTIKLHFTGSAGPELRRLRAARHDADAGGRRQRLRRQGAVGRQDRSSTRRAASTFVAEENIIIGNVALYGATSGEAFIRGVAGERFCVRNSGASAVVEGVGDHGCEYMTGGRVVILGPTGRNFAAGMSGGVAYVLDESAAVRAPLQQGDGQPRHAGGPRGDRGRCTA